MPVYDYRCADCGREVEVSHGIHAAGPSTCESCGGPMRKALSAPAIHFKGSGWAKKDARSAPAPANAGSTSGAADKPETPASSDADSGTSAEPKPTADTKPAAAPTATADGTGSTGG
jgi:putative FmdB family regulatory protein